MRRVPLVMLIVCVLHFSLLLAAGSAQELRQKFGTRSDAAAEALNQGIRLVDANKPAQALAHLETAIKEDAELQLAYYWLATAQKELGKVDEAVATYERLLAIAAKTKVNNVTVDACINAGLIFAMLKEEDKAGQWFTKAIMCDPSDEHQLHWKAYRNMAIGQHLRGKNLAAMLCALSGYQANPQRVEIKMVSDFLNKINKDEVAQVLNFGEKPAQVGKRESPTKLDADGTLEQIRSENIRLHSDLSTKYVVALPRDETKYFLIDTEDKNAVTEVAAPGTLHAACLINARLFLLVKKEGLVEVELVSGKVVRNWKLDYDNASVAVLPAQGVAFFINKNRLATLDLDSGKSLVTDYFASAVAADPLGRYCYAYKRTEDQTEVGHVIINGRPVMLQRTIGNNIQTSLMKFAVANRRPVLAELRMNTASNGELIHVSPDGQWVGVVGGGGWRPNDNQGAGAGYGIAIFSSADFSHVQGFYGTDAYPISCAINPVTSQVAALRTDDGKFYNLAKNGEPALLKGKFTRGTAWSRDGKYLYAMVGKDVNVFKNEVTEAESAAAQKRFIAQKAAAIVDPSIGKSKLIPTSEPIPEYKSFEIKDARATTLEAINLALKEGRDSQPTEWLRFEPYQKDSSLRAAFAEHVNKLDRENAGIRIYQLKKLKDTNPQHPGLELLLGMAYLVTEQNEAAEEAFLAAIRTDQGQTNISTEALRALAEVCKRTKRPQAAAYCFAHLFRLDRQTDRRTEAVAFFEVANASEAAKDLVTARSVTGITSLKLPPVKVVHGDKKLSAEDIFASVAPSVVMVRSESGVGSGLCVCERGLILTNAHVAPSRGEVQVIPFHFEKGSLVKLREYKAKVVFHSLGEDMALLRIEDAPNSLVPLSLEEEDLRTGSKVYAVGNPGLGKEVLEQSMSEGIVSSPIRKLGIRQFVQHTAAVNPGNSGGPLLNEYGNIVGLITLKAELENVGFAIPAARLKTVLDMLK